MIPKLLTVTLFIKAEDYNPARGKAAFYTPRKHVRDVEI
jgi:hypothetical protein